MSCLFILSISQPINVDIAGRYEIFPREIGRKIGEAEEIRHASDYDDFYIASREESERQVAVADEFIKLAETYYMKQFKVLEE